MLKELLKLIWYINLKEIRFQVKLNLKMHENYTIVKNGRAILIKAEAVNIFRHESLGNKKKAVTFNLVFQSRSKTLEDNDVNPVIDEIIKVVSNKYSARLR